jgi:hypothetical protein
LGDNIASIAGIGIAKVRSIRVFFLFLFIVHFLWFLFAVRRRRCVLDLPPVLTLLYQEVRVNSLSTSPYLFSLLQFE